MPKLDQRKVENLKKKLSPEQYNICFRAGTEPPGSGKYNYNKEKGVYKCVVCGEPLFSSATKFESGSGWPSFYQPIKDNLENIEDKSMGMTRTEVRCGTCGSHLGHIFPDGPEPTGQRYCINSLALDFQKVDERKPT